MIKMAANQRTQDVLFSEDWSFASLLLSKHTIDGLKVVGFKSPSPVQAKSIPLGKCGLDLIVQAKSGTGKTCVFAVVALEMVTTKSLNSQVIVLAPTREIAAQIYEFFCAIGSCTQNLHCNVFIGGTAVEEDKKKLLQCQIVIGTPGRVKSLIDAEILQTDAIRLFILDEADKLLEPGSFQDQINWIYSTLPKNKQVLALSATYPEYLAKHLINYMNEPAHIRLDTERPALLGIKQLYMTVEPHHLPHAVFEKKAKNLASFLRRHPFQQCIVFSNYQARAQMLADMLSELGWPASCIAGSQSQTDRFKAMKELKDFKCRVLISTDLTSRGIDCDKVDLVINLDMPWDCETYLHRVGRAGRFGNYGVALSLVAKGKEEEKLMRISNDIKYAIEKISDIEKVADIASDLSKPWQNQKDFLDLEDRSLNGTEEQLLNGQQDNCPGSPNAKQNSLLHDDDKHVISKSSKKTSFCVSKTLIDVTDSLSKTSVEDDQTKLLSSHNFLPNSQDSLKLFDSCDNLNGESFTDSDTFLPCKSDLSSTNASTSHMDQSGRQENCEASEQLNTLVTKNSLGLVEEVLNFVENERINCTFIMSDSKSLEKASCVEVNPQENVTDDAIECQNHLLNNESLEKAADPNEEVEERHHFCSKDPLEIAVMDLENVLGNLVCEDLIDSGARMLHEYYLSEGVLTGNLAESKSKKLESHESMVGIDVGCKPEGLIARSKGDSTECEAEIINADQNLAWSQDFLSVSVPNHSKYLQETSSDQLTSNSSSFHSDDELLQSGEDFSGSETALSDSGSGSVESNRDLFASHGILQTSIGHDVDGKEAVYCMTKSEPKVNESRFNENRKSDDIFTQSTELPYDVASDVGENINYDMLQMNGTCSSEFKHGPILNDVEKNAAGGDQSVKILQGEGNGALHNRHAKSLLLSREPCNCCAQLNESRPTVSQKFTSSNSTMPHSKQNIPRPLFDCSRQCLSFIPDDKVTRSNRYWRFCDAWYEMYRKQVTWMKYHSWQYRKNACCCNPICYNCL